jgi:hypothetical protein
MQKEYCSAGKYARLSGCLEPIGSPEHTRWVESLPKFLGDIYLEDLQERQTKKESSSRAQ